jgi:hypothetical protein
LVAGIEQIHFHHSADHSARVRPSTVEWGGKMTWPTKEEEKAQLHRSNVHRRKFLFISSFDM